jgi:hypothetical protein
MLCLYYFSWRQKWIDKVVRDLESMKERVDQIDQLLLGSNATEVGGKKATGSVQELGGISPTTTTKTQADQIGQCFPGQLGTPRQSNATEAEVQRATKAQEPGILPNIKTQLEGDQIGRYYLSGQLGTPRQYDATDVEAKEGSHNVTPGA